MNKIEPTSFAVSGAEPGDPGTSEVLKPPTPPTHRGESPSTVRPDTPGGDPQPTTEVEAAPTDDPRYNPTAKLYVPPPTSLPERVTQQEILAHNETLWGNVGPARGHR